MFLAFFVFRLCLEVFSWPFTVGFDTLAFYLPFLLGYSEIAWLKVYSWAPLYYFIVGGLYRIFGDAIVAVSYTHLTLPTN